MCEFCTKHGDGKIWYKNAANFANDLVSDLGRRKYVEEFLEATIEDGFKTLGRLETIYRKKGHLKDSLREGMVSRAKREHFGQVLPIEDIRDLVMKAETVVRMPCACRWTMAKKEERCCYGISYGPNAWYDNVDMGYFGKAPTDGLESLAPEEAVKQMAGLEEHNAIHTIWTMVTPFIGAVCNCSVEDCIAMRTRSGIGVEIMARGEHVARVNEGLCEGCGLCETRCQFDAIGSVRESGGTIARIDSERCFGCGLCRNVCAPSAISLVSR